MPSVCFPSNQSNMPESLRVVDRANGGFRILELSGEDLDDYCRNKGLCRRCGTVTTHKRVVKLFARDVKWEPLTILQSHHGTRNAANITLDASFRSHLDDDEEEYAVYKGYCLKEQTCYTLPEAKRLLGELGNNTKHRHATPRRSLSSNFKSMLQRPGKRKLRTNPETGSVAGSVVSNHLDGGSNHSVRSQGSLHSFASGISHLSGISAFSKSESLQSGSFGRRFQGKSSNKQKKRSSSPSSWSIPSFKSGNSHHQHTLETSFADSELTLEETTTNIDGSSRSLPVQPSSQKSLTSSSHHRQNSVAPIVAHRIEQLVSFDYFVALYLCNVDLSSSSTGASNLDAIVEGLRKAQTLESITLEQCRLDDEGMEKLAGGLEEGGHIYLHPQQHKRGKAKSVPAPVLGIHSEGSTTKGVLKILRLRGNRIGNRGVQALEFLFRSSSTLEELDLSCNRIGSQGAASVLESLAQNNVGIPLAVLNLAQNEIWDLTGNNRHPAYGHVLDLDASHQTSRSHTSTGSTNTSNTTTLSFLHTNHTLRELNLDGNCLHDEGAEHVAESILVNRRRGVLQKLYLGWNGIGDAGATALARAIESNTTLRVLGLAENDVTNVGARAMLSALAVNASMKEISGLYHNNIDRKFIIVAIKRLLHRKVDQAIQEEQSRVASQTKDGMQRPSGSRKEIVEQVAHAEHESDATESETSSSSSGYQDYNTPMVPSGCSRSSVISRDESASSGTNSSLALEAIENWDWGTFGIEEIERQNSKDTEVKIDQYLAEIEEELSHDGDNDPLLVDSHAGDAPAPRSKPVAAHATDRMVVFQSAPLAYFDRKSMQHHGVPMLDFEHEAQTLRDVFSAGSGADGHGNVEVVFENATQKNLRDFFSRSLGPLLHFSCHGNSDSIALENGFGYMQAMSQDALKKIVSSSGSSNAVRVVVVSSCHSEYLAEAFLSAGVPHVVSLPREATAFRDQGPIDFAKGFYGALGRSQPLREAFDAGIEACTKNSISPLAGSYKLLPEGANHEVNIFFQNPPPPLIKSTLPTDIVRDEDPLAILPKAPDQFFGREVDIYEILESLRVDDVIRIGGAPGSGKKSILSVLSRYILERSKSFQIDSVFWLPAPSEIVPDSDSLYGDLCQIFQWMVAAEDDIWDDESYQEALQRILIEMESRNSILVIDGRVFTNEIAGEMLERFLTQLLNEVNVKIILITASEASRAKTKRSSSEETTIYLGPLDYQSTVKLYGNVCPLIASKDGTLTTSTSTVEEFESYLSSETFGELGDGDSKTPNRSRRQQQLYESLGEGNPGEIIRKATTCTEDSLSDLLDIARRPDVMVATAKELEEQRELWIAERNHAIQNKYYLRANDINKALEELEDLRKLYPSLDDMKAKEADLKKSFSALLKAKRYDDANLVKRKILALKRSMMKEKYSLSSSEHSQKTQSSAAMDSIIEIQERMQTMMALAESMNNSGLDETAVAGEADDASADATYFSVSERCTLEISSGKLTSFWKESSSMDATAAMVLWTNEECEVSVHDDSSLLDVLDGDALRDDILSRESLIFTKWGPVKCATGDSLLVKVKDGCVVLAVPPLTPKHQHNPRYTEMRLRSAIRSSLRNIRQYILEGKVDEMVVGISTASSPDTNSFTKDMDKKTDYRRRNLTVTLKTIIDEFRRSNFSESLTANCNVRLFASSGANECSELIGLASELGLPMVGKLKSIE